MTHEEIDPRIEAFIAKHHVMTLATEADGQPYCAHLFYAYDKTTRIFTVTTSAETRHGTEAIQNERVAGSITVENRTVGLLRGLQFCGRMYRPDAVQSEALRKRYLRRFPYAAAMPLDLWAIELTFAKLTDNRLGFGKKITWCRS